MCLLPIFYVRYHYSSENELEITLTPNQNGEGSMTISWENYPYQDKVFQVYQSKDGTNFKKVSVDWEKVELVRCLQIYPTDEAKNQLQEWIVNTNYGQGKIAVDSIFIDDFNNEPDKYLRNETDWFYHVIFFGTWDSNNDKDMSDHAKVSVDNFIKAGRGVIFGHDTLRSVFSVFQTYGPMLDLHIFEIDEESITRFGSSVVTLVKTGLISKYPNNLGSAGTKFDIPFTHTSSQQAKNIDDINFYLECPGYDTTKNESFYITIKNNLAMVQTGHSNGEATYDEQKILANLIFYCNQLLFNSYHNLDREAIDTKPPLAPQIRPTKSSYKISAVDQGSLYYYYVESFNKFNTVDCLARSEIKSQYVSTGIDYYLYVKDTDKGTTVGLSNGIRLDSDTYPYIQPSETHYYLHVAAVDKSGNLGPTTTIDLGIKYTVNLKRPTFLVKHLFLGMGLRKK